MSAYAGICQAIHGFFRALDECDYAACAALFAPEGHWHRQGKLLEGREALKAALEARPKGLRTRHLITNILLGAERERSAAVSFYSTVFAHQGGDDDAIPPVPAPALIAVYEATLVEADEGWFITALASKPSFRN